MFLPIKQPRASNRLSSCYRILPWFHGRKQIHISSSEKYNEFTFPQFLLIQFLSDTGAHLFISCLCLRSLAKSHIRFSTLRIMIPGPGCFSLLQQHTAPVKISSITLLLRITLMWIQGFIIFLDSKACWSPKNQFLQPHSEGVPYLLIMFLIGSSTEYCSSFVSEFRFWGISATNWILLPAAADVYVSVHTVVHQEACNKLFPGQSFWVSKDFQTQLKCFISPQAQG